MMIIQTNKVFLNEEGRAVSLGIRCDSVGGSIAVSAYGPNSSVDHTWTQMEALMLHKMLGEVLNVQSN